MTLTTRQLQIARALTDGHTVREIAAQLQISYKTVEKHRQWLYARLGVQSIGQLVRFMVEHPELRPPWASTVLRKALASANLAADPHSKVA